MSSATSSAEGKGMAVTTEPASGLSGAHGVCCLRDMKTGKQTLLIAEYETHCFKEYSFGDAADRRVLVIAGSESKKSGFKCGAAGGALFTGPTGVCVDPTNSNRIYLSDNYSVRLLDRTASGGGGGVVSLIAGGAEAGFADGAGSNAKFDSVYGLVCTSDGQTLIACDYYNHRIRSIAIKTGVVTTIAGDGDLKHANGTGVKASLLAPRFLAFDRTTTKPESVLLITCADAIVRFDLTTGAVRAMPDPNLGSWGIACAANGMFLVTCNLTSSLYSFNPTNGKTELLVGSGVPRDTGPADGSGSKARFNYPYGVALIDSEQCVMIADFGNKAIRRVALPPQFFSTSNAKAVTASATAAASTIAVAKGSTAASAT